MGSIPKSWDLEADLVVAGSGCGSMTAAMVTHDLGKKVVVLEKFDKVGGVSALSAGEVLLPNNSKMKEAGIPDSDEVGRKYFDFLGSGYNNPKMLDKLLAIAPQAVGYLEKEAGVKFRFVENFPDYYYPHIPYAVAQGRYLEVEFFNGSDLGEWQDKTVQAQQMPFGMTHKELFDWGGMCGVLTWDFEKMAANMSADLRGFGAGLMGYIVKAALVDRKIPAFIETGVNELIMEKGRVIGVKAKKNGKDFYVRALAGVVLGISGYDHNKELARYYEDLPDWESNTMTTVEGDNLILGAEVGAMFARVPPNNQGTFLGFNIPGELHPNGKPLFRGSPEGGCPHAMWVNCDGRRYCDESFYKHYLPKVRIWDGPRNIQVNYPTFLIIDGNFREKYPLGTYMPGDEIPEDFAPLGETPRELAEKLNINGDNLGDTIERYNKFCAKGVDEDFGKGTYPWASMMVGDRSYKNPNMAPLDNPPYRGIRLVPLNSGINSCGLKINTNAQVMNVRGEPIKGLYAVGNAAAYLDTGAGYQSGIANMRGITWGYIAAHHAAKGA